MPPLDTVSWMCRCSPAVSCRGPGGADCRSRRGPWTVAGGQLLEEVVQGDVGVGLGLGLLGGCGPGPCRPSSGRNWAKIALAQQDAGVLPFVLAALHQIVEVLAAAAGGKDELVPGAAPAPRHGLRHAQRDAVESSRRPPRRGWRAGSGGRCSSGIRMLNDVTVWPTPLPRRCGHRSRVTSVSLLRSWAARAWNRRTTLPSWMRSPSCSSRAAATGWPLTSVHSAGAPLLTRT